MKKFTKAILSTTACVLMGACTLGLTGCIGNSTDLTETVKNISEINTTITNQTNSLKEEIKNLQEQNAQLQEQVNGLLNKQARLNFDEAWDFLNYSTHKILLTDPTTLVVTGTQTDLSEKEPLSYSYEIDQVYSLTYGDVVVNKLIGDLPNNEEPPFDTEYHFSHLGQDYIAYLKNNSIVEIEDTTSSIAPITETIFKELNLRERIPGTLSLHSANFTKDDVCFTQFNNNVHELHLFKVFEFSEAPVKFAITYIVKIDTNGNMLSAGYTLKSLGITDPNYTGTFNNYSNHTYNFEYCTEQNANLAKIEEQMAEILNSEQMYYNIIKTAIDKFANKSISSDGISDHFTRNIDTDTYECAYKQLAYGATDSIPYGEGFVKVVKQSDGTYIKYQKWDEALNQTNASPSGNYTYTATIINEAEARRICLEDCPSYLFTDSIRTYNNLVKTYGKNSFSITKNGNEYIYEEISCGQKIIKYNSDTNTIKVCYNNIPGRDGQGNELPLSFTTYSIGFNQDFFDSFDVSTGFPTPTSD